RQRAFGIGRTCDTHRFSGNGSEFVWIHRHGLPPSSVSSASPGHTLLPRLPILPSFPASTIPVMLVSFASKVLYCHRQGQAHSAQHAGKAENGMIKTSKKWLFENVRPCARL